MEKDQDRFRGFRQVSLLTAIPVLLVLGPVIGWWFGSFLDRRWGTSPYLMMVFIVLGFVASGRETWNLIKLASGPDVKNKEN